MVRIHHGGLLWGCGTVVNCTGFAYQHLSWVRIPPAPIMCRNLSVRKERLTVQFFTGNCIPSKYKIEEWVRLPTCPRFAGLVQWLECFFDIEEVSGSIPLFSIKLFKYRRGALEEDLDERQCLYKTINPWWR